MQKKTKKGFTLIELLVVIAIIALLLAILMPSLGKAKEKAKQIVCKSHLKGIGLAVKLYLTEYENKSPQNFGNFYEWINPDTDKEWEPDAEGKIHYRTYWGVRFKDYAKNKKIFSCASFAQYKIDLATTGAPNADYVMNDNRILGGYGVNPYFKDIKVGRVRSPSEYIIAQDHVEPHPDSRGPNLERADVFFIKGTNTYNTWAYRKGNSAYAEHYRGIFRHSKKNTALDEHDTLEEEQARIDSTNDNPNGQSDTLRMDGSVDAMNETNGKNVRASWYTGGIMDPLDP